MMPADDLLSVWRDVGGSLSAWFEAPSHTAGAALVRRIVDRVSAGKSAVPAVGLLGADVRSDGVRIRIHPASDSSSLSVARAVVAEAEGLGLTADPSVLQQLEVVVEAADPAAVIDFWRLALGHQRTGDRLVDPLRRDPGLSVHRRADRRPLRNRIHLDVGRTSDEVERIRRALGQQPHGPWQVALSDAEGNEVDLVPGGALGDDQDAADWRVPFAATVCYPVASFVQGVDLAVVVAGIADEANRPLQIDLRADVVVIDSGKDRWEDPHGGADAGFVELARRIQTAARSRGLVAAPELVRFVQFGIDALDVAVVRAFWLAALDYRADPRAMVTDLYDPRRMNPVIFFQDLDPADEGRRQQRNRIRLRLLLPGDHAAERVAAAVAAGGTILTDDAPRRWMISDPEGNELELVAGV